MSDSVHEFLVSFDDVNVHFVLSASKDEKVVIQVFAVDSPDGQGELRTVGEDEMHYAHHPIFQQAIEDLATK